MQPRSALIELAQRLAAEAAERCGDIWAALLAGSAGRGDVSYYTDLDIWYVATTLRQGFSASAHEQREGVFVAPTIHARDDFSSLERVDRNLVLKLALAEAVVVYDPAGELAALQAAVRVDLQDRRKHVDLVALTLRHNLQRWAAQSPPLPLLGNSMMIALERVNILLNPVLCALAMQKPTRRRRLVRMREVAELLAAPDVYSLLLDIHGVADATLSEAPELLEQALLVDPHWTRRLQAGAST